MRDPNWGIRLRRFEAVERLDEGLRAKPFDVRRLSRDELACYKNRGFVAGWRFPLTFDERAIHLDLLVPEVFPYLAPLLALAEPPEPLTWPHVEEDGVLCLLPESASYSTHDPHALAQNLIISAQQLVDESIRGKNQDDFLLEFHSYWRRSPRKGKGTAISLLAAKPPSRIISVWRSTSGPFFGEDERSLTKWLQNRFGGTKPLKLSRAALLWMDRPLYPREYPSTSLDVSRLAQERCTDSQRILIDLIEGDTEQVEVVLGAPTINGACFGCTVIPKPDAGKFRGEKYQPLTKGFRPTAVPRAVRATRYWQASSPVSHLPVQRADREWIHGRDRDCRQETLASSSVVIVGCGSVGGWVAKLLAMAGVGHLLLIDPESIEWANTGRHILGANSIGEPKAKALAQRLTEDYPHLVADHRVKRFEEVSLSEPVLDHQDLVIGMTGRWTADCAVNDWHLDSGRTTPTLYGWTEPNACAGHALGIVREGGCFECSFVEFGTSQLEVTAWDPEDRTVQEPACGATFQPFGPIELNHTITLIAEYAIDLLMGEVTNSCERIWACTQRFLSACGGEWTKPWLETCGGRSEGGFVFSREWPPNKSCPSCGGRE